MTTAGFFNPIHPWATQVLGEAGAAYLAPLDAPAQARLAKQLRARGMAALVVARGGALAHATAWRAAGLRIEQRDEPAHEIVHALRRALAAQGTAATVHGVLLDVHGVGVLLEGAAASGKSTLALDLLARGHALVADDAVELRRPAPGILIGAAPAVLSGYLAVRGLGVLDVKGMHGARSVRRQVRLDLVVRLAARPRAGARARLSGNRSMRRLLGEAVPALSLPQSRSAKGGHNLPALVEAACLDRRLRLDGIEADAALVRRQAQAIGKNRE
jgi:HPr kinase/phosphorylase